MSFRVNLLLILLAPLAVCAQRPPAFDQSAQQSAAPASATGINLSGPGGDADDVEQLTNKLWDTDSDWIDMENGTFNWKGRTFNIGNSRIARARFERYLATPLVDENTRAYLEIMEEISQLLSQVSMTADTVEVKDSDELEDQIYQAWQLLFEAGRYELDEGMSINIANQVYNIWRVRSENRQLVRAQNTVDAERRRYEGLINSSKWVLDTKHQDLADDHASSKSKTAAQKQQAKRLDNDSAQASRLGFQVAQYAQIQKTLAAMDGKAMVQGIQAKVEFQSQLVSLLLSRRYQHAIVGCNFYRYLFRGAHQNLNVGKQQIKEFVPVSDFKPTVETIELVAREAMADVKTGLRAVDSLYASNEKFSALERLQEAFFLGEYTASIVKYPYEKKRSLLGLYRKVRELENLMDLKDYDSAEGTVSYIRSEAEDFPTTEALSAIKTYKNASTFAVMAAEKSVYHDNDPEAAERHLQRATELWPLNPKLEEFTSNVSKHASLSSKGTALFDKFVEMENWRGIYNDRLKLGAAISRDENRLVIFEGVVTRLSQIDMQIAQANALIEQGEAYLAWEFLLKASELDEDDPELARAKAKLAPRVANFASAVDSAQRAEQEGNFAVSLNRYLAAQDIFPLSHTCDSAIKRVARKLLDKIEYRIEQEAEAADALETASL